MTLLKSLRNSRYRRHELTIVLLISISIFAGVYALMDKVTNQQNFRGMDGSALDYVYYSILTQASVGYGDIVPVTAVAKMAACVQMLSTLFLGLYLVSYINSAVAGNLNDNIRKTKRR